MKAESVIIPDDMASEKSLKLGVVIPCYNEEDTILACLDAVLAQTPAFKEIIIVDNNSTDATVEIIEKCKTNYPQIRLLHEKKQGVQFARNKGLSAAKSDVIARIDADTLLEEGWTAAVRSYYDSPANQNVGAASGYSWYYDLPFPQIGHFFTNLFTHVANRKFADSHTIYGANMTIRNEAWQKIKDEVCMRFGIMEDQDTGYHVRNNGFSTGYIPAARAKVSGRRMRMNPLRYWRYNAQWWQTYANHGLRADARRVRVMAWFGNGLQASAWLPLLFHHPVHGTFRFSHAWKQDKERRIP